MTEDILAAFDRYVAGINAQYDRARQRLSEGDGEGCQMVLAVIAQQHARSALSLRSVLIKRKIIHGDED